MPAAPSPDALVAALAREVGDAHVTDDPSVIDGHARDLTGRFRGTARCLVRPGSTDEVSAVMRACAEAGVPVTVQGGNTGLVGGAVPRAGEVLLSTVRLDALDEVDRSAGTVLAGAGVVLADLQRHVRRAGLDFAVDHGGRGGATIGGMVATNAGGARCVRYGMMRAHVRGVEAVLADGTVLSRLAGLVKDNAGYDLTGLLVGSEGTLGIVTRARLGLIPHYEHRVAALLGVPDLTQGLDVLVAFRELAPSLEAVDFFSDEGLDLVCAHRQSSPPLEQRWPWYLVAELAGPTDPLGQLEAVVERAALDPEGIVVADTPTQRESLWAFREGHNEALNARGVPQKLDVSVPLADLPSFEREVRAAVTAIDPGARTYNFGHLGDGNVHVNVLGTGPPNAAIDEAVLRLVGRYGGSISAEHGVGVAKAQWLGLSRSPEEIAVLRALKRALDPAGLLGPGRVLAADGLAGAPS